ncbi:conserved transmembrane protein [Mycobacteroides abscessus subsp. abscessus]|nr:conserved transmembrane protein [Mycobacteroides abscessus subsp. abscessus]
MRPAARMPKLTRRSRILVGIALLIVGLLMVGPRLVDAYVDWLWFGEVGFRSVFSTVLVTRLVVFLVAGVFIGAVAFGGMALAYRSRPVFVPASGPNDPVARYRATVLSRLRLFAIGVPAFIGLLAGFVAQTYWVRVQLFLHGGSFGITDPEFGKDLGFYAFDLPFYRLVLGYLFVGVFLMLVGNLLGHYVFGGIRLSGRQGALSRAARMQLVSLVGILVLLKAVAYWFDRYELLSHTRAGKPFTGAGYTDINAVLPAKLILLAIAVICAVAVFSALVLRDLRIPAIGLVLLLLSSVIVGAGWPMLVEQFSVKPNAAQKERDYISRSITATRDAYGLTGDAVTYRDYSGNAPATAEQVAADRATTSNIRLLDPTIVGPAFTQFQQGKNFYSFPDQLSIDRYNGPDGKLRDFVVAARELNPDRLIDNQRDWINKHSVYTHGNGFIASPANTVRGIANDPNQNGGYPEFLASVVGANGAAVSPGPAPLDQPRVYFGPVIASAPSDYAIVGKNGADREYDYETNTETKNYTYGGTGGVDIGNWLARSVFAAKFAERNFLFSSVIGPNSKILFNRDPAHRVEAVAPWLTTDSTVYPAIVNKRMVWIVDGYTTLDNYPYSELTSLSSATADSNEVAVNRMLPDKQVSYIRNSVKATVDAYDGTVTLYEQDEHDPVLQAWMKVFPDTVKPKSAISKELAEHLRYPEDLFKVQRMLLAKYHVNDPVTFFSTSDFWDVPLDPNPTASSFQPPYYIVAKDLATGGDSSSFQLTTAMNRFRRDFLAAYISASSDPATYGKITVLTIPGQVNGPKLAFNAISTDTAVSQDLGVIGRDNQNRIRWGNLLTLPVGQGGLLYVAPVYASPGASDAASSYPRLIRVAMMYNDKVGYGPTVRDALNGIFGPGAGATATGPAPTDLPAGTPPPAAVPGAVQPPAAGPQPPPVAVQSPGVPLTLSPAKAAALQDVNAALDGMRAAQQSGNFAQYGAALQKLDDAMAKYRDAK